MREVADRLRALRESIKISQAKIAEYFGVTQASINRYENAQTDPPFEILMKYADYFDVSMDYIFGRTDKPQGALYEYRPKLEENNAELRRFIEMCFDPASPMNDKLKDTLYSMMLQEGKKK